MCVRGKGEVGSLWEMNCQPGSHLVNPKPIYHKRDFVNSLSISVTSFVN